MGTELAVIETKNFSILSASNAAEVLAHNLGDEQIKPSDLDCAKVPSGGGSSWEIPSIDGVENTKEITGVIVWRKDVRAYWETKGVNGPPNCSSLDCITGVGDPGRSCAKCPFAKFGSSTNERGEPGRGQACKQSRLLFVIREGAMLPIIVRVPPASLDAVKKYMMRLTDKNLRYSGVVTRLSLAIEKNADGIKFATIVPTVAGKVSDEDAEKFFRYGESMRHVFEKVSVDDLDEAAA